VEHSLYFVKRFARVLLVLLAISVGACLPSSAFSYIRPDEQIIRSFVSKIHVLKDSRLDVVETITIDFQNNSRHGIFRIIPTVYERLNNRFSVGIRVESITDDQGNSLNYVVNQPGNDMSIKIGDPNHVITGKHVYEIHYIASRCINFFDGEPEVYWNVTGSDWPFRMERVSAEFYPPEGVDANTLRTTGFEGARGSKQTCTIKKSSDHIEFSAKDLDAGQGLTLVIRLPSGSIVKPSTVEEFDWWLADWWPAVLNPLLAGLIMYAQWYYLGRDPGNVKVAGVEFSPPKDLSPAEVGTLVDESCDMTDVVSTLVDLAARGFIKIKELPVHKFFYSTRDYQFNKLPPPETATPLRLHEQLFMAGLFSYSDDQVRLSDLKYKFYPKLRGIKDAIYGSLVDNGYFAQNPETCRTSYRGVGALLLLASGVLFALAHTAWGIGLVLSAGVVYGFAGFMPARTMKGVEACRLANGFKRFVQKAEKDRIRVLAKDDPTIFGRLLPYAMVLGAADQWAEAFHDLLQVPPDWYEPYGYGSDPAYIFSSNLFVNDLSSGLRTCSTTFASTPPSSPTLSSDSSWSSSIGAGGGFSGFDGGGSVGGGFGGGGGGSW
jgi:hypothetical protein